MSIAWQNLLSRYIDQMEDQPHTDLARQMADELLDSDDPWARSKVEQAVTSLCIKALNDAHKDLHSVTVTLRNGRKRKVTSSSVRQVRNSRSGDIVGLQRADWWAYDLAGIEAELVTVMNETAESREREQVLRAVRDVMRAHPDCTTAREAWAAEGRSVDEIDLSA